MFFVAITNLKWNLPKTRKQVYDLPGFTGVITKIPFSEQSGWNTLLSQQWLWTYTSIAENKLVTFL